MPPLGHEAIEPAILADSEVPPTSYNEDDPSTANGETTPIVIDPVPQAGVDTAAPAVPQPTQHLYDIEKMLGKKYTHGTWNYRVKWF